MSATTMLLLLRSVDLTLDAAARELGLERAEIDKWLQDGEVPHLAAVAIRWWCSTWFLYDNCINESKIELAVGVFEAFADRRPSEVPITVQGEVAA